MFRGSEEAAALLAKYVEYRHGGAGRVHCEGLALKGAWDYVRLWSKAQRIYRNAPFKAAALLTGGTNRMSVALALTCMAPGRRLQYRETGRDWQGQPLPNRDPTPVVIDPGIVAGGAAAAEQTG